ncbi:hypothetical protein REPUB_Repub07fG0229000 [Reevesia pubescens]
MHFILNTKKMICTFHLNHLFVSLKLQQNNENGATANFCNPDLVECGNGSNMALNSDSLLVGELTVSQNFNHNNDESFDDEEVDIFFQKFDGSDKRQVKYTDFNGLEEELQKVKHNVLPPSLTRIVEKIKTTYGDITEHSTQSNCAAFAACVNFYATVKEMDELKELKDVTLTKLRVWRDAILDAFQIKLKVEFAMEHLMKIARAYVGSKAYPRLDEEKKRLEVEYAVLVKKIQVRNLYQVDTIYFSDKPLNTGLFPHSEANEDMTGLF